MRQMAGQETAKGKLGARKSTCVRLCPPIKDTRPPTVFRQREGQPSESVGACVEQRRNAAAVSTENPQATRTATTTLPENITIKPAVESRSPIIGCRRAQRHKRTQAAPSLQAWCFWNCWAEPTVIVNITCVMRRCRNRLHNHGTAPIDPYNRPDRADNSEEPAAHSCASSTATFSGNWPGRSCSA